MKKSILNLGKVLNKKEQRNITGSNTEQPACNCNYSTGRWNNPICGTEDCREREAEGPGPLPPDPLICYLFPNTPGC
ncbi:hypothetical protein [uncultured Tenacibaculum sp.]|uniref:hypothetical protein n=1 Tax=uncultured Tenacibaculum sp. TaxID=174713 RepID=UPI00261FEB8E|nr:hypothetical protein [uncultured Tenacibaculum sp.]